MRRFVLTALLMLAACNRAPSSPSSPAPAPGPAGVSGLWTGTFRPTSCTGDRHCTTYWFLGSSLWFTLNVRQTGSRVAGSFSNGPFTADVTGDMNADGWVTLSGTMPPNPEKGSMRVTAVRVRATAPAVLEGHIAYETTPSLLESSFVLPSSYGGAIVAVTKMPQ